MTKSLNRHEHPDREKSPHGSASFLRRCADRVDALVERLCDSIEVDRVGNALLVTPRPAAGLTGTSRLGPQARAGRVEAWSGDGMLSRDEAESLMVLEESTVWSQPPR